MLVLINQISDVWSSMDMEKWLKDLSLSCVMLNFLKEIIPRRHLVFSFAEYERNKHQLEVVIQIIQDLKIGNAIKPLFNLKIFNYANYPLHYEKYLLTKFFLVKIN